MKRIIALFIAVLMTVCMPFGTMKAYGDETNLEIVFEYDGIHAGSMALISVLVNGSKPAGDSVTWTVSGNQSEKTLVLTDKMSYPGGNTEIRYLLNAALDETAEEILIKAELKDDPSVYDELTVQVLPPNYISKIELSNAEDATKIYVSETASDALSRFGNSYVQEFPVPHQSIETRMVSLIKVQKEYMGQKPGISRSEHVRYDDLIAEDEEYYFMIVFDRNITQNGRYHYDPDGIDITYNGEKVDDYEVYDGSDPMYMSMQNSLLVYIKAEIDNAVPVQFIDRLVLSNAPDAVYVDSSMKVIEGIRSFTKNLKAEAPESGIMGMVGTGIYRVPDDYDGDVPDYTKFEYLDYDAYLNEGSEYYFVLAYQISVLYYYDPVDFKIIYNGRNADHWAYGKDAGPDGFLKVYIKAKFADENDVSVVPIGVSSSSYVVSGNILTTDINTPLAAGYYSEGSFVPLEAAENSDGSHSFTAPEGVYELVLALKGDVNQDGRLSNADSTKLKAAVKGMTELDPTQILASDVNNDGKLSNADSTKLKAVIKGMSGISW